MDTTTLRKAIAREQQKRDALARRLMTDENIAEEYFRSVERLEKLYRWYDEACQVESERPFMAELEG